jgi:hypothetical protein
MATRQPPSARSPEEAGSSRTPAPVTTEQTGTIDAGRIARQRRDVAARLHTFHRI